MTSRVLRFALVLCAIAALCSACEQSATQLVALVDTDYAAPDEMSNVAVVVQNREGVEVSAADFALNGRGESIPPRFALPLSFGIVPVGDDPERRVLVIVTGVDPAGRELVQRSARTGFIEGDTLLLPMFLQRTCERVRCDVDQTCDDGVCVSNEVDPRTLDPIEPGDERDASIFRVDASDSVDAAVDAAALDDAGFDAATPDGGPIDGGPSDAGRDAGSDAGPDAGSDAGPNGPRFVGSGGTATSCGTASTRVTLAGAVPAGDTLVVSVVWRDVPGSGASATDSRGNSYSVVEQRVTGNPLGSLLVASVVTPLASGDSVTVTHPSAAVISVVVDRLTGVSASPLVSSLAQGRNTVVADTITSPAPGLIYVVQANLNNVSFTPPGSFLRGSALPSSCPVAFGTVDHRTYHRLGGAGAHPFSGTLASRQQYLLVMAAFGPP